VQAPKQRATPRAPRERGNGLYLLGFAGLAIVIVAAVLGFVAFGGGGGSGNDSAGRAVTNSDDCTEQAYAGQYPKHLNSPEAKPKYNSDPPSSGPHYQQPAPWNLYTEPVKQVILVHNLEHGGIVIQYGSGVSDGDVKKLESFYQDDPYGLVVAPFAKLGNKFALTAWNEPRYEQEGEFDNVDPGKGYVLTCTKFDSKTFAKFRDERRNKAGERFASVEDMAPGT